MYRFCVAASVYASSAASRDVWGARATPAGSDVASTTHAWCMCHPIQLILGDKNPLERISESVGINTHFHQDLSLL